MAKTLGGQEVRVVEDGDKKGSWKVCPGDIEVVGTKEVGLPP